MFWLVLALFLLNPIQSQAISEFTLLQKIDYTLDESGNATVDHHVELTNNFSQVYATNYQIKISTTSLSQINASDSSGNILDKTTVSAEDTQIDLKFNQPTLGKGKTNSFKLNYKINNLAVKKGNTWEISLPENKNLSTQDSLEINLDLPPSFGNLSFNSIPVSQITHFQNRNQIKIIPKTPGQKILLIFGSYQLFDFNLDYHLQNPTAESKFYDIAIPPDTEYQFINYTDFKPPFSKIYSDIDGNWLARYELKPKENISVKISGQAKISSKNPEFINQGQPDNSLSENTYWPLNNPTIKNISQTLSSPKEIYDYTIRTLSYDYNAINSAIRKGALGALSLPDSSLCTEFTDLFVTLARSKGIPAREIEGYAYSNNPKIKPININADILHAWPQYYDKSKNSWNSIDPTWAKTTNGIDYFNDLDLNHFTFVIHGQSSTQPLPPGSYKNGQNIKTVDVSFSKSEFSPSYSPPLIKLIQIGTASEPLLQISNPNKHSLRGLEINSKQLNWTSSKINLLPLESLDITIPKLSAVKAILPNNSKISFTITSPYFSQTPIIAVEKYSPHYFNLIIFIGVIILLLTVSGIILTVVMPKKHQ